MKKKNVSAINTARKMAYETNPYIVTSSNCRIIFNMLDKKKKKPKVIDYFNAFSS